MRHHLSTACFLLLLTAPLVAPVPGVADAANLDRPFVSMDQRLDQVISFLDEPGDCSLAGAVIDLGLETLYGGLRPLPSRDLEGPTREADEKLAAAEAKLAEALEGFARSEACPEERARALDLKLFVEQMNEVALAVGRITLGCGEGTPCDGLVTMLDEATGHEVRRKLEQGLRAPFSIKLRSPFVPWRTVAGWEEDVFVTEPIASGECVAIFKETRGLMLRLRLERIDVVRDPWATPQLARGTKIPIWSLEWVPSQYGKTWRICNRRDGGLETSVSQVVKQDVPLNYFWRYFPAAD